MVLDIREETPKHVTAQDQDSVEEEVWATKEAVRMLHVEELVMRAAVRMLHVEEQEMKVVVKMQEEAEVVVVDVMGVDVAVCKNIL